MMSDSLRGRQAMGDPSILGLVLAGGLARRMGGGDKARIRIGGTTILERVLARLAPQCGRSSSTPTAIRRASPTPACRSCPIRCRISPARSPASSPGSIGRRRTRRRSIDVASVPGDCPFLPRDLVTRLQQARKAADLPLACARSGDWRHPVVGLWPVGLRDDLRHALVEEDLRKIEIWTARHGVAIADWPAAPVDPFFNVNTPEDAAAAERIAAQQCGH